MQAIPTAKYVVGRGPAYNFAHSFNAEHGGFLARHSSMSFATEAPSGHSPRGNHARVRDFRPAVLLKHFAAVEAIIMKFATCNQDKGSTHVIREYVVSM